MGKPIRNETKALILKVLTFFENEKANKQFPIPVDQAVRRTCLATGVSKRMVMKIKSEAKKAAQVVPPAPGTASGSGSSLTPKLSSPAKKRKPSEQNIQRKQQLANSFEAGDASGFVFYQPQTPEETETLIVKVEPSEQYEESEMVYTPVEVKLEPGVVASGSQVDPIAVEIQTEPCVYGGKRTNETLAPDVPATNKGRGRKRQRKDDETTQHTQGLTTARASSSVPTRDVDENSLLAEGAIKTEEIETQEEGFS